MTRINTNVSSLMAQKTLARSNDSLQQALTRLSTGLRINSGKDDPAGLIASEALRSDMISVKAAISNNQRANQMIATADSALGEVSSLLNDIRGLVTEAANEGVLSADQIAANQLQVDASLAAINRIAQTSSFQGQRLVDGSLGFNTEGTTNFAQISDLSIEQATLGASSLAVDATVTTAATQAQVDITNVPAATAPVNAWGSFGLANGVAQADSGAIALADSFTLNGDTLSTIQIVAEAGDPYDGGLGNLAIAFVADSGVAAGTAHAAVAAGTLTITVMENDTTTLTHIQTAVQGIDGGAAGADFAVTVSGAGLFFAASDATTTGQMAGGRTAGTGTIQVTADTAGVNTATVTLAEDGLDTNNATADFNAGNIEVHLNGTVSHARIAEVINALDGYSAELVTETGDTNYIVASDDPGAGGTLANGAAAAGGLAADVTFSVGGLTGSQAFQFDAGSSINQMLTAVNAMSSSTGVAATINATTTTTLELKSSDYGSDAFVDVRVIDGAIASVGSGTRDTGDDVVGRINGIQANGSGNTLSINTATLAMEATVNAGFTGSIDFSITGGGAQFQLGPEVLANQQSRIGIQSVDTASLAGASGRLYTLAQGGAADLSTSTTLAAAITDEVISKVAGLRGRLGAFQKTTLDTNIRSLSDTLENLTDAESSIRDADFAAESAALTRSQILVQSGVSVLGIANSNPQNVLALLR